MKRRIVYIAVLALLLALVFYTSRGPNLSNYLKKIILPELEIATGNKFIAQKIYINILPLFIEIKDLKGFDGSGNRILAAKRVKGYIGISGLLRKEIVIKRLIIKEPGINSNLDQAEKIVENIKRYLAEETKMPFKVVVKSVGIDNGTIGFQGKKISVSTEGIEADIILSMTSKFRISLKKVRAAKEGIPEFNGSIDTYFFLKEKEIELKDLKITSYDSELRTSGVFGIEKLAGKFQTEMNIVAESLKKIFALKNRGEGKISARGEIKIDDFKSIDSIFLDLRIKGDMYLETLMELLNVKEKLAGHMEIDGELKGNLRDLHGNAKARLKKGNLFGVNVVRLNCNVFYNNGIMRFVNGKANLYGGSADVEAMIHLPVVDYYSLDVNVRNVDSKGIFKLIGWDPLIARGKVSGKISSSGAKFNPHGEFLYISRPEAKDVIDRIREISGRFSMQDDVIRFENMSVLTEKSGLLTNGIVDIPNNRLNFAGSGTTKDIRDISSPYFTAVTGAGSFNFSLLGTFDDPLIDLNIKSNNAVLSTSDLGISDIVKGKMLIFQIAECNFSYKKDVLNVKDFIAFSDKEEYKITGNVNFHDASKLFDLKGPYYNLNLSIKNANIQTISDMFYNAPLFSGYMDTEFRLFGKPEDIRASGEFRSRGLFFNDYSVDYVWGRASYEKGAFYFKGIKARKADSELQLNGEIYLDGRLSFSAEAQKIKISDVMPEIPRHRFFESISLTNTKIKGKGTFKRPTIEITSDIYGGKYNGYSIGEGRIKCEIRDKHVDLIAGILDGKLNIKGNAELTDKMPWSAKIDIKPARYDFLIEGLLKDIPEDLLLNISGNVIANGDKDHINAEAKLTKAHIYLYGIGFTNSSDINLSLKDRRLSIEALSMKSDDAEFSVSGSMLLGKNFDLVIDGYSSLAPVKALSKAIDILKGNASFVFSLTGDWNRPKINGGMDINNGVLGFKDIYYRLTSLNAFLYIDEDRVVIERASGRLAGGDVKISGTAYLQRFSLKKFFIESRLDNITASISKDFWVNFGGNLYYRGTSESQMLLGNININKARYSERVDWKTLILKAKQKDMPKAEHTLLQKTSLNVNVAGDNLIIDNNLARAAMKMDLLIRGIIGQPILIGKIETKDGIVYFRNNEFRLSKASLDFSDPYKINPYFDIVAETKVREYNIRLSLDGYAEHFNMALSSSPALDEMDIFALLTVGRLGKDIKGLEGGIGIGEATSFLTGEIHDVVEERLKTITGFDRVQVDPHVSKTTGTIAPRVTVAKRLLGDKLYVTYSTGIGGTAEEQILQLEYNLTKGTSLVGRRDERGGLGGDIKFRFEFK